MKKAAGHVLKSNNVKLEGRLRLDVGQGVSNQANEKSTAFSPAQVRIVENHPEFAILELTCSCGTKTHIRCEYADVPSTEQGLNQKVNGENNNDN